MMKTTLLLKGLGLISMTTLLFGCPPVDNNATQEPDEDMSMTVDMGGGGEDQGGGGGTDQGGGGGTDQGGGGGTDQGGGGTDQGGGDPDQGGVDPMPPETFEEAREQDRLVKASIVCKLAFECSASEIDELIEIRLRYASKQECIAQTQSEEDASYAQQKASLDANRATFDVARAQQCIADLNQSLDDPNSCDLIELIELFERCDSYVSGSVPDGGDCVIDSDCQGSVAFCEPGDTGCAGTCIDFSNGCDFSCGEGTYCDGEMCVPNATLGQDCDTAECAEGLFCNFDLDTPVCEAPRMAGADCFLSNECQEGLYCDFDTEICTQKKAAGQACLDFEECVEGTYCDDETGMCTEVSEEPDYTISVAQEGQPCLDISETELAVCAEGFYCTDVVYDEQTDLDQGTCKAMAQAAGGSCFYDFECALGLECDVDQEVCVTLQQNAQDGAPCEFNEACSSGYCNFETETCASPDSCTLAP